jgi:hypothetical protein
VSILTDFDFVGAGFVGVLPCNEMLQMIARPRKAKNIYVALKPSNNKSLPTDINGLIKGFEAQQTRINSMGNVEFLGFDSYKLRLMAARNEALNNFEQQFLILVQLKGYGVKNDCVAVAEHEILKTKDVKALVCEDVLIKDNLTATDAERLRQKNDKTQSESYQLDKYNTAEITGKSQNDLTAEDVHFFKYDGGLIKVQNFELINPQQPDNADFVAEVIAKDKATHETRQKLPSKYGKLIFLNAIISQLQGKAVKRGLIQQCLDCLHDNHAEVAINGLGNFKHKTTNIRKLQTFLEKCGYELNETGQESTGNRERIYTLQVNEQVKTYADNRKRLRQELLENDLAMA